MDFTDNDLGWTTLDDNHPLVFKMDTEGKKNITLQPGLTAIWKSHNVANSYKII